MTTPEKWVWADEQEDILVPPPADDGKTYTTVADLIADNPEVIIEIIEP